ncbi:hypothetical protein FUA23_14285 [Neolewinella aurantiaca]|uniref:DUF2306 domain-containing protein n=1 Tax=Neolewinella aurantiaca TaxID=2602767 RepID=A0A5C7FCG2_9BACT|nr:DUF2306 domain-containing protein [Neolewinella aurantiaca]TXF88630.1 hypothetical protein FUA23_14285 [Neolewinella aurantiaca]
MLLSITQSPVGFIHFLSAVAAMLAGGGVLFLPKGTVLHRRLGYIYVVTMVVMLGTAFSIYSLYGEFGLFHYLAVFSSLTLIGGMVPVILKKPKPGYVSMHFSFMYWSVIGLYMAFVAETAVRLPQTVIADGVPTNTFYTMVAIGSGVVMVAANVSWFRNKKRWQAKFDTVSTLQSVDK